MSEPYFKIWIISQGYFHRLYLSNLTMDNKLYSGHTNTPFHILLHSVLHSSRIYLLQLCTRRYTIFTATGRLWSLREHLTRNNKCLFLLVQIMLHLTGPPVFPWAQIKNGFTLKPFRFGTKCWNIHHSTCTGAWKHVHTSFSFLFLCFFLFLAFFPHDFFLPSLLCLLFFPYLFFHSFIHLLRPSFIPSLFSSFRISFLIIFLSFLPSLTLSDFITWLLSFLLFV